MIASSNIEIFNKSYDLVEDQSLKGTDVGGYTDRKSMTIRLNPDQDLHDKNLSVLHEIIHEIDRINDLQLSERQIHLLEEHFMTEVLRNKNNLSLLVS